MSVRRLVQRVFEGGFSERDADEARMRGYRSHVWAELDDGSRHRVTFYDVERLAPTLEDDARAGRPFFAERGLVVVAGVTLATMEAAVRTLAAEGYFDSEA